MAGFMRIEDLVVYQKLCQLHVEVSAMTRKWPRDERFELSSQVNRSSNSAGAQLAEKHSDRHVRNKIEGTNRARGEALETVHHLHIARCKKYMTDADFTAYRERYHECVRMLNGLERTLEQELPRQERRFPTKPRPPNPTPEQ